jgi:hypothetical protein
MGNVVSARAVFQILIPLLGYIAVIGWGCRGSPSAANNTSVSTPRAHYPRIFTYNGKGARPSFENDKNREIQFIEAEAKEAVSHGKDFWSGVIYEGGEIGFTDCSSESYRRVFTGTATDGTITWVRGQD